MGPRGPNNGVLLLHVDRMQFWSPGEIPIGTCSLNMVTKVGVSLRLGEVALYLRNIAANHYLHQMSGIGTIHDLDSLMVKPDSVRLRGRAKIWELERQANLSHVDGNPWKSFLYLVNWFRTGKSQTRF